MKILICQYCTKEFSYPGYFKETCSKECASLLKKKRNVEKYGVENPMQRDDVKNLFRGKRPAEVIKKIKKAWEIKPERELKEIQNKREKTSLENFGVKNPFQSKEVQEKIKKVNQEKLGVDYPMQSPEVLEKSRKTCMENYGVDNPMKCEQIKNKAKQTSTEIYGYDNPSKSPYVINEIITTNNKRYGANSKTQANVSKQIRELLNSREYLEQVYVNEQLPMLEIAKRLGCSDLIVAKRLREFKITIRRDRSSYEIYLKEFLEAVGITNIVKNYILPSRQQIDIYLPDYKMGFEINGIYWHSERVKEGEKLHSAKTYHLNKTNEAESLGIHLVHIYEDDWILKNEIIKNRILQLLNKNPVRVYARKCTLKEISTKESNSFLNSYHIQGASSSAAFCRLGLFYKEEIVGCMTFSKLRKNVVGKNAESNTYELLRFATKGSIVGGASKLFSYFIKKYNPVKVISYADRHWTSSFKSNVYDKLTFKKINSGNPNYWYVIGYHREHRFNWRKTQLKRKFEKGLLMYFDKEKSEYENMLLNGYDRIWGCGSFKYEWVSIV